MLDQSDGEQGAELLCLALYCLTLSKSMSSKFIQVLTMAATPPQTELHISNVVIFGGGGGEMQI